MLGGDEEWWWRTSSLGSFVGEGGGEVLVVVSTDFLCLLFLSGLRLREVFFFLSGLGLRDDVFFFFSGLGLRNEDFLSGLELRVDFFFLSGLELREDFVLDLLEASVAVLGSVAAEAAASPSLGPRWLLNNEERFAIVLYYDDGC